MTGPAVRNPGMEHLHSVLNREEIFLEIILPSNIGAKGLDWLCGDCSPKFQLRGYLHGLVMDDGAGEKLSWMSAHGVPGGHPTCGHFLFTPSLHRLVGWQVGLFQVKSTKSFLSGQGNLCQKEAVQHAVNALVQPITLFLKSLKWSWEYKSLLLFFVHHILDWPSTSCKGFSKKMVSFSRKEGKAGEGQVWVKRQFTPFPVGP